MNYLAHAYLSFNEPGILAGNMISDFVKGKKKFDYPLAIQKGIMLHRSIDTFTDEHVATKKAKEFFRKEYRLYSGPFVDIVYDHFLARDRNEFKDEAALKTFSTRSYAILQSDIELLPERFRRMFPYMKEQDWFYNYQFKDMIDKSFSGLARRALYLKETKKAFEIFNDNYKNLQLCYDEFFPSVKKFSESQVLQLLAG